MESEAVSAKAAAVASQEEAGTAGWPAAHHRAFMASKAVARELARNGYLDKSASVLATAERAFAPGGVIDHEYDEGSMAPEGDSGRLALGALAYDAMQEDRRLDLNDGDGPFRSLVEAIVAQDSAVDCQHTLRKLQAAAVYENEEPAVAAAAGEGDGAAFPLHALSATSAHEPAPAPEAWLPEWMTTTSTTKVCVTYKQE